MLCHCGLPLQNGESRTARNLGKLYSACPQSTDGVCIGFVQFHDPKFDPRVVEPTIKIGTSTYKKAIPIFGLGEVMTCICGSTLSWTFGKLKCARKCKENWRSNTLAESTIQRIAQAELQHEDFEVTDKSLTDRCVTALRDRVIVC